jgi:hypothetical protein
LHNEINGTYYRERIHAWRLRNVHEKTGLQDLTSFNSRNLTSDKKCPLSGIPVIATRTINAPEVYPAKRLCTRIVVKNKEKTWFALGLARKEHLLHIERQV